MEDENVIQGIGDESSAPEIINDGGIEVIKNFSSSDPDEIKEVKEKLGVQEDVSATSQGNYKYMPAWDVMKSQFEAAGMEWNLPEPLKTGKIDDTTPLTPEAEFEMMRDMIIENTDFGFDQDPLMAMYLQAKERDGKVDPNSFIEEYQTSMQIHNMESKDFLFAYLRNTSGQGKDPNSQLTDDVINSRLASLSKEVLDTEAQKYKAEVLKGFYEDNAKVRQRQEQEYLRVQEKETEREKMQMDTIINSMKTKKGFDGLSFDDNTLNEFNTSFTSVFTRGEENPIVTVGLPKKFVELLTPENLYKAVAYLSKGESVIKSKTDERVRALEEQLGIKPLEKGQSQLGGNRYEPI